MVSAKTEVAGRTVIYQSQLLIPQNQKAHIYIALGKCELSPSLTDEFVAFDLVFSSDTEDDRKRVEAGPNEEKEGEGVIDFINIAGASEPGIVDELLVARLSEPATEAEVPDKPRSLEIYLTGAYQDIAGYHALTVQFTAEIKP